MPVGSCIMTVCVYTQTIYILYLHSLLLEDRFKKIESLTFKFNFHIRFRVPTKLLNLSPNINYVNRLKKICCYVVMSATSDRNWFSYVLSGPRPVKCCTVRKCQTVYSFFDNNANIFEHVLIIQYKIPYSPNP